LKSMRAAQFMVKVRPEAAFINSGYFSYYSNLPQ
jgi:hypothetical protein